ncbi:hypothetical protein N8468_04725 [Planktomarina temperata]|nr:hypothetical protein [Planktomarina temperata]
MQAIEPLTITDSLFVSSNLTEDDYAAWSAGTTYALGNRVIVVSVHKVYESAANSNIGNDPTTDTTGTYWIEVGATNKWKAFDQHISDPATNPDTIQYVISSGTTVVNSLAFFGLSADTVQIQVVVSATEVYNTTFPLLDTSTIVDWYTYFFEPASVKAQELLVVDLPAYTGATITVTITDTGQTVQVGQVVLGNLVALGRTGYGSSIGIEDYSRKERDTFGNPVIVERAFAQKANYEVSIPTVNARRVQKFLSDYRATPIVWIGNQDPTYGLIVYGFYTQFSINLSTYSTSYSTIEVEGLT